MRELIRYAAVGAVATAVHYGLLAALVESRLLLPADAAAVGAWTGAQVAYFGNALYTFAAPLAWPSWARFQAIAALGALVSFVLVGWGIAHGLHYLVAQAIASVVAMALTFLINQAWTFERRSARPGPP